MNMLGMASKFGRSGLLAAFLAGSLLVGGGSAAGAVNENVAKSVKSSTDYVAAMVGTDKAYQGDVSNHLNDTAAHESGGFAHSRQLAWKTKNVTKINRKGKKYSIKKKYLSESGVGRSRFSIEPETGHWLFHWSQKNEDAMKILTKSSGLTEKQLSEKTTSGFADLIQSNEKYAAATAWTKYMSRNVKAPGTISEEAGIAAKNYFVGKKEGRIALQAKYKAQFIRDANAARNSLKNPVLDAAKKKIGHNAGTASTKAASIVKKTIKKIIK